MSNELQSLSLIFQNRLFRIPDYQRGYAWQQSQLVDFWDDLINLQEDRFHYTGMLSLKNLGRAEVKWWGKDLWVIDKGFKPCYVVDGQQRLTTFVILINELVEFARIIEENKGKTDDEIILGYDSLKEIIAKYIYQVKPKKLITTYLFGYEVDNPSSDYLRYKIFKEPYPGTVNETYYTKNLKFAKQFFKGHIEEEHNQNGVDGLCKLYTKLTQRLMFNIHEIADDYDVFVAFETMNNRGKKLTNLELLKNRLIYLTTLYPESQLDNIDKNNLRSKINDAWKEVYYQLGRNENTPLSDDEFLRAHWISYFTFTKKTSNSDINFLLKKFSAKNIYEKNTIEVSNEINESQYNIDYDNEEIEEDEKEIHLIEGSKLMPQEILDYVNSMKDLAKYWYDTYFPKNSEHLTKEEQLWVDRLNRIGIGYFRPLIMVVISRRDISEDKKLELYMAIERFIFICFRLGTSNGSFRSSECYRATRKLYFKKYKIDDLIEEITETTNSNIEFAIPNFVIKIEKYFEHNGGFYYWNSLKYFLFEYELDLAKKNNLDKMSWELFTKSEKDKVSIEHILPQTPNYYWQNQFRQFTPDEIESLSGALGNLLPLSQSINSSLQNDSFEDKKYKKTHVGRCGYQNGSHSEIEVSMETDWSAARIYKRSKKLLKFMEKRWQISFTSEQLRKLIYVTFAIDDRMIPEPLTVPKVESVISTKTFSIQDLGAQQLNFWCSFVEYCKTVGRDDIACRKPLAQCWYDITVPSKDFILSFTITRGKYITLVIYVYYIEAFYRLESLKEEIEEIFGDRFDWYSSREKSKEKRILYRHEFDIFGQSKKEELFSWMIEKFDALYNALFVVGELEVNKVKEHKFDALESFLQNSTESDLVLEFNTIEEIIGTKLCNSAYEYKEYWNPSKTHVLPNRILKTGYEIKDVDLVLKQIHLKKIMSKGRLL